MKIKPSYKWKSVDISTLKGLKKAEWYKAHGWKVIHVGINIIIFEKKVRRPNG